MLSSELQRFFAKFRSIFNIVPANNWLIIMHGLSANVGKDDELLDGDLRNPEL